MNEEKAEKAKIPIEQLLFRKVQDSEFKREQEESQSQSSAVLNQSKDMQRRKLIGVLDWSQMRDLEVFNFKQIIDSTKVGKKNCATESSLYEVRSVQQIKREKAGIKQAGPDKQKRPDSNSNEEPQVSKEAGSVSNYNFFSHETEKLTLQKKTSWIDRGQDPFAVNNG